MKYKALLYMLSGVFITAAFSQTAPDFTATDTKGNTHHLYEYCDSGKYVLIEFFFVN